MNRDELDSEPRRFFHVKFRFSLTALFILMLISTVAASGASYLWAATQGKTIGMMVFFPFVLIVPFGVTILAFWLRQLLGGQEDEDHTQYLG